MVICERLERIIKRTKIDITSNKIKMIVNEPTTFDAHPGIAIAVNNRITVTVIIPSNVMKPKITDNEKVRKRATSLYTDTALRPCNTRSPRFKCDLPFNRAPLFVETIEIGSFDLRIVAGK